MTTVKPAGLNAQVTAYRDGVGVVTPLEQRYAERAASADIGPDALAPDTLITELMMQIVRDDFMNSIFNPDDENEMLKDSEW